jgi:alkylated DNA repair dioxygenase AlkB
VHLQLGLFAGGAPRFDRAFGGLERRALAGEAWIDVQHGWVSGADWLFDHLERTTRWRSERRVMYDREVAVPRLIASLPGDGPGHPILEEMRLALAGRYQQELVRVTVALYRDGQDSVAWHGDTTARDMDQALVATVSLGMRRKFLLRPAQGGDSIALQMGGGDLLVMGGSCQRTWRHAVPKVAQAGPRLAVMFRPDWSAPR